MLEPFLQMSRHRNYENTVISLDYSHASFPSKLDKQMAKAWRGQSGKRKSMMNMSGATRPNWSTR